MLSIGELSRATDCKVETIRYYEKIGLMPEPARSAGNQRRYGERHRDRLHFMPYVPICFTSALTRHHRQEVEARIRSLEALRDELDRMLRDCAGGDIAHCGVIQTLADHGRCDSEHI